jgi:hypothetical protein
MDKKLEASPGRGLASEEIEQIDSTASSIKDIAPQLQAPAAPEGNSRGRVYCRNPKCRSKLKAPTDNLREAFCTRGCHSSFYLHRCLVCERPMPRNAEHQKVCYRNECKRAWRLETIQSRFLGWNGRSDGTPLKTSIKLGLPEAVKAGRGWHVVAGEISPEAFHCATVSDGRGNQWKRGSFERIEAQNQALLKAPFAKLKAAEEAEIEANGTFTDPGWREVVSPDGVKCFVTQFPPGVKTMPTVTVATAIPDDLAIPDFLRRQS